MVEKGSRHTVCVFIIIWRKNKKNKTILYYKPHLHIGQAEVGTFDHVLK